MVFSKMGVFMVIGKMEYGKMVIFLENGLVESIL
jgi:hypothetical protein